MKKNNKVTSEICFVILPFGAFMNISRSSSPKTFIENQIGEKTFFIHKKVILVNIFGGIVNCEIIAKGINKAYAELGITMPVVCRLEGLNVDSAKAILAASGYPIVSADSMGDAAVKAVEQLKLLN